LNASVIQASSTGMATTNDVPKRDHETERERPWKHRRRDDHTRSDDQGNGKRVVRDCRHRVLILDGRSA
jgi:hypothetical protein